MGPLVGLGVDAQYSAAYFGTLKNLIRNRMSVLSHVSVSNLQSTEEARSFLAAVGGDVPLVHHLSGVAPADPGGPHLDRMRLLNEISSALNAEWTNEDIGFWSIGNFGLPYFAPPVFEEDVARVVAQRVMRVLEYNDLPLLLEIPPCSCPVGRMSLGEFFSYLIDATGCPMTLDISHVYSYALATGQSYEQVLRTLPTDAVWEIHIAGGRISPIDTSRYIDTHADPVLKPILDSFCLTVESCPALRAVTYEIMPSLDLRTLDDTLSLISSHLQKLTFTPVLGDCARA